MARGLFASDFAVSLALFVLVLALAAPLWDSVRSQAALSTLQMQIQTDALKASDALVNSPGSPREWNASTAGAIGLADEEHVLNATKVLALVNMLNADYYRAKSLMGLPAYEVNISVTGSSGSPIVIDGIPASSSSSAKVSVAAYSVRRIALLQKNATTRQIVNLNLVAWK